MEPQRLDISLEDSPTGGKRRSDYSTHGIISRLSGGILPTLYLLIQLPWL